MSDYKATAFDADGNQMKVDADASGAATFPKPPYSGVLVAPKDDPRTIPLTPAQEKMIYEIRSEYLDEKVAIEREYLQRKRDLYEQLDKEIAAFVQETAGMDTDQLIQWRKARQHDQ